MASVPVSLCQYYPWQLSTEMRKKQDSYFDYQFLMCLIQNVIDEDFLK